MSLIRLHKPPVLRRVFRGQAREGHERSVAEQLQAGTTALADRVAIGDILTLSAFRWGRELFLYFECVAEALGPGDLLRIDGLEDWPGVAAPRDWVPMMDIFHYDRPVDLSTWCRGAPRDAHTGRVIRLRPEHVSSYVFYHFQLQEERPGAGDRYGIISLHENLLFFYAESPPTVVKPEYRGLLQTQHTPDDWPSLMSLHFQPWDDDDGEKEWRPIEHLASI